MSGRIRSIKPEILEDEKVAQLSHLEFRLFVGSWLLADDYGNLRGDPDYIRGQIVWSSRESRESVAKALWSLARVSLLVPYRVREQRYLHIRGWDKHQRVDKPGKPRMPGLSDPEAEELIADAAYSRDIRETPANIPGSLATDLRPPTSDQDHEHEQEGERGNQSEASPSGDLFLSLVDKVNEHTGAVGAERAKPVIERRRGRKPKPTGFTADERIVALRVLGKLSAQNGVRYTGTDEHLKLIASRLREGIPEMDLRAVIGYCALELEWKDSDKMRKHLTPETLFGPKTIHRYLDPARTWFEKLDDEPPRAPAIVDDVLAEPDWMREGGAA